MATLSGKLHGSTYDEQVAVDMGAGDDFLRLDYSSADVIGQNVRLSGGDNTALNFGQGKLGDILSLGHEQSASAQLGGVSSRVAQGFETLHLDFADNDMDVLNLDDLLANISRAGFTGGSSFKSLVITGDGQSSSLPDMLFMDGASLTGSDIALSNKQFEGQTFDQYTAFNSDNDQIEVFVATGLWVL